MLLIIEALLILAALGQIIGYQLDMASNSVDDQYEGCTEKMAKLVETKYLKEELKNQDDFKNAWNKYEKEVKEPRDNLTRNHLIALRVYTCDSLYRNFNKDVRNDKSKYKDETFKWYSLHFLLTEAIQILKRQQKQWHSIYRGTRAEFHGERGTEFRFGSFSSFSQKRSEAQKFGEISCFEIEKYEGAELTDYSEYRGEKEVLIPPYETFKVTDVKTRKDQNDLWCDTVFILEITETRSDLNCALFE